MTILINGTDYSDTLQAYSGTTGDYSFAGLAGDDYIVGGSGNDTIDGGLGNDTVKFSGKITDYDISFGKRTKAFTVKDLREGLSDGTDVVLNVEKFVFSDYTYTASNLVNIEPTLKLKFGALASTNSAGTVVGTLKGADLNKGDKLTYSLVNNPDGILMVNADTGEIQVATGKQLGLSGPELQFEAKVTDNRGSFSTRAFVLNASNINYAPVGIVLTGEPIKENSKAGTLVGTL
jgi:Ca2+-binding RTX toxin-like protein